MCCQLMLASVKFEHMMILWEIEATGGPGCPSPSWTSVSLLLKALFFCAGDKSITRTPDTFSKQSWLGTESAVP